MVRPSVYLQRAGSWYDAFMTPENEAALNAFANVISERDRHTPLDPSEVLARLRGCDAVLSLNGEGAAEITPDIISAAGSVKLVCIAQYWGWGHFTGASAATGVPVVEGSSAASLAVAEWNLAAALAMTRKLHRFDAALKAGSRWGGPRDGCGMLLGKRAGLVGLGRIGRATAHYFRAVGLELIGYSRSCPADEARALGIRLVGLDELLATSDIVCLNHRVTDATRGLLGEREFALLKDGSLLINAARAGLYDEAALVRALRRGRFSACLDVFEEEPLPRRHPLRSLDNVMITPHVAGNNPAMFARCARDAIATLRDFAEGRPVVDRRFAL
jgi:phosphoglycerate dehydrogenase-like enzyme